jgi:3-phenylpropionate/cinnamic acid dioxygenase small subunit
MQISAAVFDAELAALSYRYAAALDHRDRAALLTVFHPQATLRAHPVGRNPMVMTTHHELSKLIAAVEHQPRTFHVIGQALYQRHANRANREVYCAAYHFNSNRPGDGDDYVMYIRYLDSYVREPGAAWLIAERDVVTDAVERRDVAAGGP